MMRWFVVAVLFACSPISDRQRHVEAFYPTLTDVSRAYHVDGVTPLGIRYRGPADPAHLDSVYTEVAACVAALPPWVRTKLAGCAFDVETSKPQDFVVVLGQSRDSCALPGWRTLEKVLAPPQACEDKGQDTGCPCTWRGVYRATGDGKTDLVIVADDQRMIGTVLASLWLACNPWYDPAMAQCASIGTQRTEPARPAGE
jgi:hypothetical protein